MTVVYCTFSTTHCPTLSFVYVDLFRPRTLSSSFLTELFSCKDRQGVKTVDLNSF